MLKPDFYIFSKRLRVFTFVSVIVFPSMIITVCTIAIASIYAKNMKLHVCSCSQCNSECAVRTMYGGTCMHYERNRVEFKIDTHTYTSRTHFTHTHTHSLSSPHCLSPPVSLHPSTHPLSRTCTDPPQPVTTPTSRQTTPCTPLRAGRPPATGGCNTHWTHSTRSG